MPAKPRVYIDSCCFIELALQSIGKHKTERDDDLWHLKALFDAALDEKIELLTSTLSIAECTHAGGDVSEDVKTLFKRLLTSGRFVLLVQDSVLVAERARNLRWAHGLSFSGADAIHIASAMEMKCDEFLTWDEKIHAQAVALGNLSIPVHFPRDTAALPMEYRQQLLPIPAATGAEASDNQEASQPKEAEVPPNEPTGQEAAPNTETGDKQKVDSVNPTPDRRSDEGPAESETAREGNGAVQAPQESAQPEVISAPVSEKRKTTPEEPEQAPPR